MGGVLFAMGLFGAGGARAHDKATVAPRRFVLYTNIRTPPAHELNKIKSVRGLKIVDHEIPRLMLVEAPEASLAAVMKTLPNWTMSPESPTSR
jgi:hypothetical protein